MRHQKNSGNKRVRQQKKHPNKPSSMRDYNPRRQERVSGQSKGKRGEQNPLEGLDSEKELIITRREDLSDEPSEEYPLWETNSLADEVGEALEDEDLDEEENSSEDSSEETEPSFSAKDATFSSPEENTNTHTSLNHTEENDVIDAPVFSKTNVPHSVVSSSEDTSSQVAQTLKEELPKPSSQQAFSLQQKVSEAFSEQNDVYSAPTRTLLPQEQQNLENLTSAVLPSAEIKSPTSDIHSFTKEISDEPDISSKTTAKMISKAESSFMIENSIPSISSEAPVEKAIEISPQALSQPSEPTFSSGEFSSSDESASSGQDAETPPHIVSSKFSVPDKLCQTVTLEELIKNRLSPGINPASKRNRRGPEREPHHSSTVNTEKDEGGVISFRPSSEKTETIAAKLANIAMEEEDKGFGEGLGVYQQKTPEKTVSGQMRSFKKTKNVPVLEDTEEQTPFGSGLLKPEELEPRVKPKVEPKIETKVEKVEPKVEPKARGYVARNATANVAQNATANVAQNATANVAQNATANVAQKFTPKMAPKMAPKGVPNLVQKIVQKIVPSIQKTPDLVEDEDEDDDTLSGDVRLEEDDDGLPYDMNSLVNSLDKGGEDKFRAFQKRKYYGGGTSNGNISSHPGVVRAYSSEYLDEQSKNAPPNAPSNLGTVPAPVPSPQDLEKEVKPFNRDYQRRDDRNRSSSKEQDRNRKDYRNNNYDSSNEAIKPKEEGLVSDRSDSRNRFDPKKGKSYSRSTSKELDTRTSTPYVKSLPFREEKATVPFREERKFSREERMAPSASEVISYPRSPMAPSSALFVLDLNHPESRRWLFILLFLILVALVLNVAGVFWPAENYRSYYLSAQQCIDYGDWEMAKEKLRLAIRQEPSHTKARLALAYVELRQIEDKHSQTSIQNIAQEIQLIRNILDKEFPGQVVNDSPDTLEGKFLDLVYHRFYTAWKQGIDPLEQDPHYQILSKLWKKETESWTQTTQRIHQVSQATTKYIQTKQEVPSHFALTTLLTEIDPQTKKPYLSSESSANEFLLDGWGHSLQFKIELLETPEENPHHEFALKIKSLGADGLEDREQNSGKGWSRDIEKNYSLSVLKKK